MIKAEPASLVVQVIKLQERTIVVKVYNQNQTELLKVQTVEPSEVRAYVFEGQPAEAHVRLTSEQQLQALKEPVSAKALVKLPLSDRLQRSYDVKVRLSQQSSSWPEATIQTPRVGYVFPDSMIGKYKVVIENLSQLKEPIKFRGSASAITDYRNSQYHLYLEIHEGDKAQEPIYRRWRYNLQDLNDIQITEQNSLLIQFHLVPVTKNEPPPISPI